MPAGTFRDDQYIYYRLNLAQGIGIGSGHLTWMDPEECVTLFPALLYSEAALIRFR